MAKKLQPSDTGETEKKKPVRNDYIFTYENTAKDIEKTPLKEKSGEKCIIEVTGDKAVLAVRIMQNLISQMNPTLNINCKCGRVYTFPHTCLPDESIKCECGIWLIRYKK